MVEHELKIWPQFFSSVLSGEKTCDLRKDDRAFRVNDILILREWEPLTEQYTGRIVRRQITHLLHHDPRAGCAATYGLTPGYVIISLSKGGS